MCMQGRAGIYQLRRRAKSRSMDAVNEDMKSVGETEEDADDGVRWRKMFGCGHHQREEPKGKEEEEELWY